MYRKYIHFLANSFFKFVCCNTSVLIKKKKKNSYKTVILIYVDLIEKNVLPHFHLKKKKMFKTISRKWYLI